MDGHRIAGVIVSLILLALGIGAAVVAHKLADRGQHAMEHFETFSGINIRDAVDNSCRSRAVRFAWSIGLLFIIPAVTGLLSSLCKRKCMYITHIVFEYMSVVIAGLITGAGFLALGAVMYSRRSDNLFDPDCGEGFGSHGQRIDDGGLIMDGDKRMMIDDDMMMDRPMPEMYPGRMDDGAHEMCRVLRPIFHLAMSLLMIILVSFLLALANIIHAGSMTGRVSKKTTYQVNEEKTFAPCVYVPRVLSPDDVINTCDKSRLILEA